MGNVGTFSTEPVLNNTPNEGVSQVRNNLNENTADSLSSEVKNYKLENPKNIVISHLNFNSLRNKFISIEELIKSKLDIFLVSETKIDHSFPNQQFSIDGYKIYHRDRNSFGRGLLFYVNENILCRELTAEQIDSNFEIIFLEITIWTRKWLIIGLYKRPNQKEEYFCKNLGVVLNNYLSKYEHIILLGDFNLTTSNKYLADPMKLFNLVSLINTPTCFQSEIPRCIDLIITNKKSLFKNSKTFEVGISDHHHLILTSMRIQYIQGKPKTNFYRDYKSFNFESFRNELNELLKIEKDINYSLFENIFLQVLNAHAPVKKKMQRFHNNPFMTKQLRKAIMHRSRLKNVFNKSRTPKTWDSYKKQRNFFVNLLRKTKKEYFENINVKDINDNKRFWKTIKPFFSNKGLNTNKLMIIEKNNLISEESILANTMNQYFTSITKQLNLKKSPQLKNLEDIINYYHNHISIEKIRSSNNTQSELFTFNLVSSEEIKREILNLNNKKTSREGDIPVNILKDAIDTYLPILTKVINSSIEQNEFSNELKLADVIPIYKKKDL